MPGQTTYLDDKLIDLGNGVASYAEPTVYVSLMYCSAGTTASPRSAAVTLGQTTVPATPNGHMYRCTTAGTTGASEPSWLTGSGDTVTDGTAVWTEMTPDFLGQTHLTEASYAGYARAALVGLMGAAAAGSATNASQVTFAQCTAGTQLIAAFMTYDAATAGNGLRWGILSSPLLVSSNITPDFPASNLTTSMS